MNRGELWIGAESGYTSKPRPTLIIQSDRYSEDESVVTCLITSYMTDASGSDYRVALPKTEANGLKSDSFTMIDKIVAIPRKKLVKRIGIVDVLLFSSTRQPSRAPAAPLNPSPRSLSRSTPVAPQLLDNNS